MTQDNNSEMHVDKTLDCIGLFCPMPIFNTTETINSIQVGEVLEVLTDDPASIQDIPRWAKRTGHKLLKFEDQQDQFRFLIKRSK
jgi:tRNA 2-thiouridine synthesizing protein A